MIIENFNKTKKKDAKLHLPYDLNGVEEFCSPIGNSLSYNESSVHNDVIKSTLHNKSIFIDLKNLTVDVSAGVTIKQLINHLRKYGLFPYVVPGTSQVTIGGAVSNNIHGKNQISDGLFCDHVESIKVIDKDGKCSTITKSNPLFQALCGGIGTIAYISEVRIKVRKLPSDFFNVSKVISKDLSETLNLISDCSDSVAWIDMSARNKRLGRGVVMSYTYSDDTNREVIRDPLVKIPKNQKLPFINPVTSFLFCRIKYIKDYLLSLINKTKKMHFSSYLFPLDKINGWNNLYGKFGFYQFQALIPYDCSKEIIEKLITHFQKDYLFSPIVVIKEMKKSNTGHLSFSGNGYTICFDLPKFNPLSKTLTENSILEAYEITTNAGGLIYLAKDELMDSKTFTKMYKNAEKQKNAILKFNKTKKIFTAQAFRYGL
ncbi:FAD binding domain protein [Vibrio parahaemolyticus VPCR-2010]|uniref:FAD-binding oxidoreductase n=1 Tax=Vibrio parahaemolyticus TaxID=670 RepID=UPI00038E75F0|nr:FAD binding domain protein [Vibrio parahaemolyticus VPCR-2010]